MRGIFWILFRESTHPPKKTKTNAACRQWFKWYSEDIFLLRSSRFRIKTLSKIHPTLHYTMRKLKPQRIKGQAKMIMFDGEKYLFLYFLYVPWGSSFELSKDKETRCLTAWISGFRFRDDHIRGQKKKRRGKSERKKKKDFYKQIPTGPLFHSALSQSQDHSISQWSEATLWENILSPEARSTAL